MDINILHEFAVLAEHLNYTTAAKELHISQSSLSRHISSLERFLGVPLFIRKDKLALTLGGAILLEESSSLFTIETRLLERLKESKETLQGIVRLEDYFFSQEVKNFFLCAIKRFHETYPGINFEFVPVKHSLTILNSIQTGYFDVGVLVRCGSRDPGFPCPDDFRTLPLFHAQSRLAVYLHKSSLPKTVLENGTISINNLRNLPIVLPLRPEYANFKADFSRICAEHGFAPSFQYCEMQSFETLAMIDMVGCAQIVLEYDVSYPTSPFLLNDDCTFVHLEEEYYATPYLLFAKNDTSPGMSMFTAYMEELSSELNS